MNNPYPWNLITGWMKKEEATFWKEKLFKKLEWTQPKVRLYGNEFLIPRKTIFIGEEGIKYKYSGINHQSIGWPDWFLPLLEKVCNVNKINFNGCLINLYRDGNDSMGWHSDNEKELDPDKPISSLSLGSSRDLFFKHRKNKIKNNLNLKDGDLLIMYPHCQKEWIHSIPVRKRIKDFRINLTFRSYKELALMH